MSTISVMVAVAIAVAVIALVGATWRRSTPRRDLGSVSSHWISEHRLGSNRDYSRR